MTEIETDGFDLEWVELLPPCLVEVSVASLDNVPDIESARDGERVTDLEYESEGVSVTDGVGVGLVKVLGFVGVSE